MSWRRRESSRMFQNALEARGTTAPARVCAPLLSGVDSSRRRMAYDYRIELRPRLVCLRRIGAADVADWRETMLRLLDDPAFVEGTPILFDVSHSDSNPPPGQGPLLAAMWHDLVAKSSVAMVASKPETLGVAKHLELITGGHVRAFDNVEEARAWLTGPRPRESK